MSFLFNLSLIMHRMYHFFLCRHNCGEDEYWKCRKGKVVTMFASNTTTCMNALTAERGYLTEKTLSQADKKRWSF